MLLRHRRANGLNCNQSKQMWPKIQVQVQLQPSQSSMHRSGVFYIKTKFVFGFLEKQQQQQIPKAELYQNPFPLLLMQFFNCPYFTSQLCCGALVLYEKQKNDWTQCDIIVNGWQWSFHGSQFFYSFSNRDPHPGHLTFIDRCISFHICRFPTCLVPELTRVSGCDLCSLGV